MVNSHLPADQICSNMWPIFILLNWLVYYAIQLKKSVCLKIGNQIIIRLYILIQVGSRGQEVRSIKNKSTVSTEHKMKRIANNRYKRDDCKGEFNLELLQMILAFWNQNNQANILPKDLAEHPVCHRCLDGGSVIKCDGKCSNFFHRRCFNNEIDESEYRDILKRKFRNNKQEPLAAERPPSIEENTNNLMCIYCISVSSSSSSIMHCFVCKKTDANCIQCCDKNCGKAYHIECLKYWPQYKKSYKNNSIQSLNCPRHVCHSCVSPDIQNLFHKTEPDEELIKCMECPGTYHRSLNCIPAGSEFLSKTQLICTRHQSKSVKRVNINFCLFCSRGGSLICCDACAYSFHQDCLPVPVPVGDCFNCEVISICQPMKTLCSI